LRSGSRRWRDKDARDIVEGTCSTVVDIEYGWRSIDADHDIGRTVTIEVNDESVYRDKRSVAGDTLQRAKRKRSNFPTLSGQQIA
jgi:hypothetical protein